MKTNTITWTAGSNEKAGVAGVEFSGGRPDVFQGVEIVRFEKPLVAGKRALIGIGKRPELAALVADYNKAADLELEKYHAEQDRKRAEQEASDQPHIDAMLAKEAELVVKIPADAVKVEITDPNGNADLHYSVEGVKLDWQSVTLIGVASAIRTGAMGAFDCRRVGYIRRADLEKIVAARKEKSEKTANEKQAAADEIKAIKARAIETGKPQVLRQWTEERRACEYGVWGDYIFSCYEFAMPNGETKIRSVNNY